MLFIFSTVAKLSHVIATAADPPKNANSADIPTNTGPNKNDSALIPSDTPTFPAKHSKHHAHNPFIFHTVKENPMTRVSPLVFWMLALATAVTIGAIGLAVVNLQRNHATETSTTDTPGSTFDNLVIDTSQMTAQSLSGQGSLQAPSATLGKAAIQDMRVIQTFTLPGQTAIPKRLSLRLAAAAPISVAGVVADALKQPGFCEFLLAPALLSIPFGIVSGDSVLSTLTASTTTASIVIAILPPGTWYISLVVEATRLLASDSIQELVVGLLPDVTSDVYDQSTANLPNRWVAGVTLDGAQSTSAVFDATTTFKYVALSVIKAAASTTQPFSWNITKLQVALVRFGD